MASGSRRTKTLLAASVIVVVLAALAGLLLSDRTPPLTGEILRRERRLWNEQGIESYDLQLLVNIRNTPQKVYELEVRAGEVRAFAIDGKDLAGGEAYTIVGLFDMMERELELEEDPSRGGPGAPKQAALRAEFDPELHYPTRFLRLASENKNVFIRVDSFTVKGSP